MTKLRKLIALGLVATLPLVGAACGDDEDNDGADVDEEVNELDEGAEDVGNEVGNEVDKAEDEVDD